MTPYLDGADAAILGRQDAPVRLIQPGTRSDACTRLAAAVGVTLMPWQSDVMADMIATRSDRRWAARECLLLVPRQNGKTMILVLRMLAGALFLGDELILFSAHEYRTSIDTWNLMVALVEDTPVLKRRVVKIRQGHAERVMKFDTGEIRLTSRNPNAGRGLHPDLLVYDEAFSVSTDVLAAQQPSQSARRNPQMIFASSAGDFTALELIKRRERLHAGVDRYLTGWEWAAPMEADPTEASTLAEANPSLGRVLRLEELQIAQQTMPPATFRREHLGQWADVAEQRVFEAKQLESITIGASGPPADWLTARVSFGVEISQIGAQRLGASVVACWAPDPLHPPAHLSVIASRPGVDWIPEYLTELSDRYPGAPIAYDKRSPGGDLFDRAERQGVTSLGVIEFADYARACAHLAQLIAEGTVRICADPPSLMADLGRAQQRPVGAAWVWDRAVTVPPAALIAATCALYAHDHAARGIPAVY